MYGNPKNEKGEIKSFVMLTNFRKANRLLEYYRIDLLDSGDNDRLSLILLRTTTRRVMDDVQQLFDSDKSLDRGGRKHYRTCRPTEGTTRRSCMVYWTRPASRTSAYPTRTPPRLSPRRRGMAYRISQPSQLALEKARKLAKQNGLSREQEIELSLRLTKDELEVSHFAARVVSSRILRST